MQDAEILIIKRVSLFFIILKRKYESQYKNITFINNDSFHDSFIILDRNMLYSCGASFKDLGKKCFAISKIEKETDLIKILKTIDVESSTKTIFVDI